MIRVGTVLDLNVRFVGYAAGILALAFLAQGIAYSHAPLAFVALSGATAILYFLSRGEYRVKLPFILMAIGPLVNFVVYQRSPYIYNIEVVLLTYLGLWFFSDRRPEHPIHLARTDMWYLGFIFVVFFSTTVHLLSGDDPLSQIRLVRGFVMGFLLFWFLHSLGDRLRSLLPVFFGSTLAVFAVVAALGITAYGHGLIGKEKLFIGPKSVFDGSESFAIYLVVCVPLTVAGSFLLNSRFAGLSEIAVSILGSIALIATLSRSGLFAMVVYFSWRMLSGNIQKRRLRLAGVSFTLALVASLFMISLAKSGFLNIETLPGVGHAVRMILSSRTHPWTDGLSAILASPLLRQGAHENVYNVFFQIGAQFGGVAGLLFIGFVLSKWLRASPAEALGRSEPPHPSIFWSLTTFLIISLGESTLGNQFGYLCWFVIHLSAGSMQTGMSELSYSSIVNRRFLPELGFLGKNCMGHAAFLSPTLKIGDYWPSPSFLVALLRLSSKGLRALC